MFGPIAPVTLTLLIVTIGVFVLQGFAGDSLYFHFALWPPHAGVYDLPPFRPWQLITHGFLHRDYLHLLVNMFGLFMFGSEIERLLGPRRYLIYYLASMVGAGLMNFIVMQVADLQPAGGAGASGAIFGLLIAVAVAFPRRMVMLLFPPIPMPAWLFVTLFALFELYMGVKEIEPGVGHFAHLGGLATGFVLMRQWRNHWRPKIES